MISTAARKPHYEDVPADAGSAFSFREFRWPSFPFNWHYHPEVELTLIVRGEGTRFVGDSAEEFADGDLCLLGANLPHCWASHRNAPAGVCSQVVQFLPDFWGAAFWSLPELRAVRDLMDQAQRGLAITGAARKEAAQLFRLMEQQPHGSMQRINTLLEMLCCLSQSADCKPLASAAYRQPPGDEVNGKLGKILGYIHAHLGPELTQHEVAKAVRLSPQAFSQFFRRSLGTSYVAYINELKIRNACRALLDTDRRITEVAFSAGFNNLSHFNAQFRRLRHLTPRAFRQQARTESEMLVTDSAKAVAEARSIGNAVTLSHDLTRHSRGTHFDGVRVGTEDPRPWLKRYALCPALARYGMVHAGIAETLAPYQIVRAHQTTTYFLACFGGRGRVLVDGRWRLIGPGLACMLPAHVRNAFEALPGDAWRFAYVCYQEDPRQPPLVAASSPVVAEFDVDRLRLAIEGLIAECRRNAQPAAVDHWLELVHGYVQAFAHPVPQCGQLPLHREHNRVPAAASIPAS